LKLDIEEITSESDVKSAATSVEVLRRCTSKIYVEVVCRRCRRPASKFNTEDVEADIGDLFRRSTSKIDIDNLSRRSMPKLYVGDLFRRWYVGEKCRRRR
jgi:hypothetical protein